MDVAPFTTPYVQFPEILPPGKAGGLLHLTPSIKDAKWNLPGMWNKK
jgi:hypothetical protein